MTPERIAELQNYVGLQLADFRDGEIADLLATAEQVEKLREAIEKAWQIESADPATDLVEVRDILFGLRAALEQKGGEHG